MAKVTTVDAYIAALPAGVQALAGEIRSAIREAAPYASEDVKYGIPAYAIGKRTFLYFGVWKRHVGFYPIYRGDEAFEALIAPYRTKTDTVQFRLPGPLPHGIIGRIVASQLSAGQA